MDPSIVKAQALNLKIDKAVNGTLTTWTIHVPDPKTFQDVIQAGTTAQSRAEHVRALFQGMAPLGGAAGDGTAAGTLRRVTEFLFGDAPLAREDAQRIAAQFPLDFVVVTGSPNGPITGEYCLAKQGGYQKFAFDTLDLEDGGFITVYNTPVSVTIANLKRNGGPPPKRADFNVLGLTGDTGKVGDVVPQANTGGTGGGGSCTVSGSEPGDDGGTGSTGDAGRDGATGYTGGAGYPSCTTTITICALTGSAANLSFYTKSGDGGPGGTGGSGATGGQGGTGGAGATCECTGTSGGRGGQGGTGGDGGTGGAGGPATSATGNVTVFVPGSLLGHIVRNSDIAQPGPGGAGGAFGPGGKYGVGGPGGKGKSNPGCGTGGKAGGTGHAGATGTATGAPGAIVPLTLSD